MLIMLIFSKKLIRNYNPDLFLYDKCHFKEEKCHFEEVTDDTSQMYAL